MMLIAMMQTTEAMCATDEPKRLTLYLFSGLQSEMKWLGSGNTPGVLCACLPSRLAGLASSPPTETVGIIDR
jgi:hypothetical protein